MKKYYINSKLNKRFLPVKVVNNLVGNIYGKLTVIKLLGKNTKNRVFYLCKCDCNNLTISDSKDLKNGKINSCGCIRIKAASNLKKSHEMSGTMIYY